MTEVFNLSTGEIQDFSCSPRRAVVAAYAQSHGDWNTWEYHEKYSHLLEFGQYSVCCGDFAAIVPLLPKK